MSIRRSSTIEAIVNAGVRCVAVAVAISSWLAISNHCALAVLVPQEKASLNECPFHSKPAKPQKQSTGVQCCKTLRAITTAPAKTITRAIVDLADVDLSFAELVFFAPPKISFYSVALDTGPPGPNSFAELVLQRSVLAHAPPALA